MSLPVLLLLLLPLLQPLLLILQLLLPPSRCIHGSKRLARRRRRHLYIRIGISCVLRPPSLGEPFAPFFVHEVCPVPERGAESFAWLRFEDESNC